MSDNRLWVKTAMQLRGSVIPAVLPRSLFCGVVALLVTGLYLQGVPLALPFRDGYIPSIVLGLLLVFRTNTAYDRFWEGRKCWGSIIVNTHNLARQIWVAIEEDSPRDRALKAQTLGLLEAFAIATKQHLRSEAMGDRVAYLLSRDQFYRLQGASHVPLEIAFWVSDYLQHQYRRGSLNIHQLTGMIVLLDRLVEAMGGCERILRTPMPMAYAIHLKQLLMIYCLTLPFQMVKDLQWWSAPVIVLVSFTLFGIEAIGIEIENPFGGDHNDLPLDDICAAIGIHLKDLVQLKPGQIN